MSDKKTVILAGELQRRTAQAYIDAAPIGYRITIQPPSRSLAQNDRMWAMLTDIARQVEWYGKRLDAEDWKHVFSASLRRLAVVPNLDGTGFVALGLSTSKMSKAELGELMELMSAFGAERGVEWTERRECKAEAVVWSGLAGAR